MLLCTVAPPWDGWIRLFARHVLQAALARPPGPPPGAQLACGSCEEAGAPGYARQGGGQGEAGVGGVVFACLGFVHLGPRLGDET